MKSIITDMADAVKRERKERPEMSDTEIHQWIDNVMQDGIANREVSLKDYQAYQANPYGFAIRVLESIA